MVDGDSDCVGTLSNNKKRTVPLKVQTILQGGILHREPWYDWMFGEVREIFHCHAERNLNQRKISEHRARHTRRVLQKFLDEAEQRYPMRDPEIPILEYLLNEKSSELWHVPRHRDLNYAVRDVSRWWFRYSDKIFDFLECLYDSLFQLIDPYTGAYTEGDVTYHFASSNLAELGRFIEGIAAFDKLLFVLREINSSSLTKAGKEGWIREIRGSLIRNWPYDIFSPNYQVEHVRNKEVEMQHKDGSKDKTWVSVYSKFPSPTLKLDLRSVIRESFRSALESIPTPREPEFLGVVELE